MNAIEIFPWDDNFNTGIARIDEQHKVLVQLLNRLASHIVFHANIPELHQVLDELAEYTVYHFETEEAFWHEHFPGDSLELQHKETHNGFVEKIYQLKSENTKQTESLLGEILRFLTRWLASHILQSDRYMAMVVTALESGLPLEQAKQHAGEKMSGSTRVLIDIILSVYEMLSSNALELMREVAARKQANLALQESQAQLKAVVDSTTDLVWSVDAEDFGLTMFNRGLADYFMQQRGIRLVRGLRPEDLFPPGKFVGMWQDFYRRALRKGPYGFEYQVYTGTHTLLLNFSPLQGDNGYYGVSVFGKDITERKLAEESIHHLAFYDSLTNLPNRRLLQDRLRQSVAASDRHNSHGALLFVDLDNFKVLNDTKGHDFGDQLLIETANRLQATARENDTVARLGGDEFVVMLSDLGETVEQAIARTELVGKKILEATSRTYSLKGGDYHGSSSIGACLFRGGDSSADELLKRADTAMYQAKRDGRNAFCFYDPTMQSLLESRVAMESWIRSGFPHQFSLHFQGQFDLNGHIFAAEALLRWQHPERGMIPPAEFIPLAEENGRILPIGEWVMKTACEQLKHWESNRLTAQLQISVNVSARQFHQPNFVERVIEVLSRTGANPAKLKLELTESMLISDVAGIIAKMEALKQHGVTFSLDDFGTGYSSLSALKRLPLEQVKIDQSFVRDILIDANDAAIARTIVALGQSLGLTVIAEGVETVEQRDFLASHGCSHFQGYLFSRPLPIEQFEQLLS